MMNAVQRKALLEQVQEETREERDRVRRLVQRGRANEAEPELERLKAYNTRVRTAKKSHGAEAVQGSNDMQGAVFLAKGAAARRAVAMVEVNMPSYSRVGTGFLISPDLILTNQHVIEDMQAAGTALVTFDRETDEFGKPRQVTSFLLDPPRFALFSPETELDYAIVAIGERNGGDATIDEFGVLPLSDTPDRHVLGMKINIIQHPNGSPKMIAIRNNHLMARGKRGNTLVYETDTDEGTSGGPVMNDLWDVVALHHWGEPFLERVDDTGQPIPTNLNEGIRISAIYRDLEMRLPSLPDAWQDLLRKALDQQSRVVTGPVLGPPRPQGRRAETATKEIPEHEPIRERPTMSQTNEVKLTLPLEITVRIGDALGLDDALPAARVEPHATRTLSRRAEAKQLDRNYGNRTGYQEDHIPGYTIPLPKVRPNELADGQVAPLRAGEADAAEGVLLYQHFSVVMNKTRRMALYSATNIDGDTYLRVDRDTGRVVGSEGETWYKDPRISESFWTGQDFYSAWSNYFDRGHLTRRTDPTWGDATTAERANADTYHFTNCAPQHFRFNQTTKYWQGAERYVLENGLFKAAEQKPMCVFQGPIFDDAIDHWADELQIPSSFFKLIVWDSAEGLKAVGLVVDQLALLSEERVYVGQPREVARVNVNQWRVAISTIEERTGLDFGKVVREADTIGDVRQPGVGESAVQLTDESGILAKRP